MAGGKSAQYQAIISIGAKLDKTFGPAMKSAQNGVEVAKKSILIAGGVTAAAATAALTATVAAVSSAGKLQAEMSNVGTLLDGDVNGRLRVMQQELLAVSNTTGIVTSDLTDGLYQVVSAFGDSADASKQLEIAAVAAKAGNATTTDSINLLSAVTKGYNDTSLEAMQKASDLAFQTVKLGQTSYPELAASIGSVIPLANTMRGSQEDLFGAMATLTGVTGGTAEVATQLRGVYQGFLQPTSNMTKAMDQLGYADGQVMMESLGLQGTLEALKGSVGGNELAFANLFGSIEAKNAVLALTGAQTDNLTEKTQAMYEATGITNRAFATQTANLPAMLGKMGNYGKNAMTMLGTAILPKVMEITESVMPVVEEALAALPVVIEKISPVVEHVFGFIGDKISFFADNILPFVKQGFQVLTQTVLPAFMPLIEKLFAVFQSGKGQLLQFAEAILPKLANMFQIISEKALPLLVGWIQKVVPLLSPIVQKVGELIGKLMQMVNAVLPIIIALLPPAIAMFKVCGDAIVGFFTPIFPIIDNVLSALGGLIDFVTGVFTGNWTLAWEGVKSVFGNVFEALSGLIKLPFNGIISAINSVFEGIGNVAVPEWVPVIGGKSITLPQIPLLYTGVRDFPGGAAVVGDRGPEIINLPRGADVYSNRETRNILSAPRDFGGGGVTIKVDAPITIHGPITQEQARQAGASLEQEIKAVLAKLQREQLRTAFNG